MKITYDKYYTPTDLSLYLINKTFNIIGRNNITEIIEPSAGNGSFSNQINNCVAYDIFPENKNIIKQDFLTLKLDYKKGRLFIGNPPFGNRGWTLYKFYKKCIQYGDYVAFIMPAKFYNYTGIYYQFDLLHSEKLNQVKFTDRCFDCAFNIYKRPINGKFNKKEHTIIDGIQVVRVDRDKPQPKILNIRGEPDLRICGWGSRVGYPSEYPNQFAREFLIYIDDNIKNKQFILNSIKNYNWRNCGSMTATSITNEQIMRYIKHIMEDANDLFICP